MEKKYEDKFPSFDGTNDRLFTEDDIQELNSIFKFPTEHRVGVPKTYEIDFDQVKHIEDIKLILKSLNLVFDESAYEEEIGRLLKEGDD